MRVFPGAFLLGLFASQISIAAPTVTHCVDGAADFDQTIFIPITEALPAGFSAQKWIPDLDNSSPNAIKWKKNSDGVDSTTTVIGKYKGNVVTEIIYAKTKETEDMNNEAPFSCVLFLYTTNQHGAPRSRPFFVLSGEEARWFEYHMNSTKAGAPVLEIDNTSPGNGVYSTQWDFVFTDQQALITNASEGGRHVPTKEYQFSTSGKIIKTTTDDDQ